MFKSVVIFLLGISLLNISLNTYAKADIVIIASKSSSVESINPVQASQLWLGQLRKLPDIGKVKVVDQSNSSSIKEEFYEKLTHKSIDQLKVHWAKIIFTGKAVPPKTLSSDKKVLRFVSTHKNILGYINSESITDDVKVLMVIK